MAAGAGVGPMSGVSPFGTPPRLGQEEETATSDTQSEGAVGAGFGPAAPEGMSVEFRRVSSGDGGGSSPEPDVAANRKFRLQLRAVHANLKENIKDESTIVTEIVRDRANRLSKRLDTIEEALENLKASHDQVQAVSA